MTVLRVNDSTKTSTISPTVNELEKSRTVKSIESTGGVDVENGAGGVVERLHALAILRQPDRREVVLGGQVGQPAGHGQGRLDFEHVLAFGHNRSALRRHVLVKSFGVGTNVTVECDPQVGF